MSVNISFEIGDAMLSDIEESIIKIVLEHFNGNKTLTARALGISVKTIHNKVKKYNENDRSKTIN